MENKDIEKILKESAEEVKVKDFSEKWKDINDRIQSLQNVELKETTSETVLATTVNSSSYQNTTRKRIIYSVCAVFLFIAVCLAIVLPVTLKKSDNIKYLTFNELTNQTVSENEFYKKIEETDLELVNIEKFVVNSYVLLYTKEDGLLVGGKLEIVDETDGVWSEIVFYDSIIKSSFDIGKDYKTCGINGFNIEYKTELTEDYYTSKVKAVKNSTSYELECLSLDENIESFFEKIFG